MEPTLDDCLVAFSVARSDLTSAEAEAGRLFAKLEEAHRVVREKRALVARCRSEVMEKLATVPEAKS